MAILHLQSRKYCKAIMDDLILFTPSEESQISKLEDILSALFKKWIEDITQEMPIIQSQPTIHG